MIDRDEPTQRTRIPRPARSVQAAPPPTPPPPPPPPADEEARSRIDSLERELQEMRQAIASTQVIRISTPLPSPSSLMPSSSATPTPESRPSRAAAAYQKTKISGKLAGKGLVIFTVVVTWLAQALSFIQDPVNGPLVRSMIIVAFRMAGREPPPEQTPSERLPDPEWQPLGTPVPADARTPVRSFERTEDGGERGQAGHGGQRHRR